MAVEIKHGQARRLNSIVLRDRKDLKSLNLTRMSSFDLVIFEHSRVSINRDSCRARMMPNSHGRDEEDLPWTNQRRRNRNLERTG
jgi:hypothetical protein